MFGSIALTVPGWVSCSVDGVPTDDDFDQDLLTDPQWEITRSVQDILFPKDEYGPGALDLHADRYLIWILKDELIPKEERDYFIEGMDKTAKVSEEQLSKSFTKLSVNERRSLVDYLAKETSWGKYWLSRMLTMIFEAMFADPVYGSNPDGIGWAWLDYTPGIPRPTEETKYPQILKTFREI